MRCLHGTSKEQMYAAHVHRSLYRPPAPGNSSLRQQREPYGALISTPISSRPSTLPLACSIMFSGAAMNRIPTAERVLRYIASTRSLREPALPGGITLEMVMAELERLVEATIAEHSAFRIHTAVGLFVCHVSSGNHSAS